MVCRIIAIALISLLAGCDSEDGSSEIWYFEQPDRYLEITSNNQINLYTCSVHDGYQPVQNHGLALNDNILREGESYFELRKIGDSIQIYQGDTLEQTGSLEIEIPSVCVNDAIEIRSVYYQSNDEQTFVFFNYRLTSTEETRIALGVTFSENDEGVILLDRDVLAATGLQSGHLYTYLAQEGHDSGQPHAFYVFMMTGEGDTQRSIADAKFNMPVVEDGSSSGSLNTDCLTCLISNPYP